MAEFQYLDKRIQRTKINLYIALFELLKQKKYDQITIKDIISFAGYSRGSFYNHYNHKDELLNEIIDSLLAEAKKAQQSSYINKDSIDVQSLENEPIYILEHFITYGEYYQILLGDNLQVDFRNKLTAMFVNLYLEDFNMHDITENIQLDHNIVNKFYAYGLIGLILDWVIADFPTEPDEFSKELVKVFKYSLGKIQIQSNKRK